ncbi:hypothetical protein MTR67_042885 [Solanum verrucosum]|uniref:Uncharacterized protein n=1 Tax=Solanum verrucosum TaxID=315347 RepID=A0AAF0UPB1_SOLVR|nr:hypothetical protein MTR67_042885 [Solanum verrucosum]
MPMGETSGTMANMLFDPGSTYSYVPIRFASDFEMICDILDAPIRVSTQLESMTWLWPYYVVLNCNTKSVTLEIPGRKKLEWEGVYKPKQAKIISSIRASKLVEQGCLAYLADVRDVEIEAPSIESIHVVSKFSEVFPNDLPGMPLDEI